MRNKELKMKKIKERLNRYLLNHSFLLLQFISGTIGWILAYWTCLILNVDNVWIALMIFIPFIFIPSLTITKFYSKYKKKMNKSLLIKEAIINHFTFKEKISLLTRRFTERKDLTKVKIDLINSLKEKGIDVYEIEEKGYKRLKGDNINKKEKD